MDGLRKLDPKRRSELGQFMTPSATAQGLNAVLESVAGIHFRSTAACTKRMSNSLSASLIRDKREHKTY
jgi:hypothetical protein